MSRPILWTGTNDKSLVANAVSMSGVRFLLTGQQRTTPLVDILDIWDHRLSVTCNPVPVGGSCLLPPDAQISNGSEARQLCASLSADNLRISSSSDEMSHLPSTPNINRRWSHTLISLNKQTIGARLNKPNLWILAAQWNSIKKRRREIDKHPGRTNPFYRRKKAFNSISISFTIK